MKNTKQTTDNSQLTTKCHRAFSLLEVLIAMFIFVLIITVVMAIFGKMFVYNKSVRAKEANMEEAGTAFELMAKIIRMSSKLTASGNAIYMYNNSQGICVSYRFNGNNLETVSFTPATDNTECTVPGNYMVSGRSYSALTTNIAPNSGQFKVVTTSTASPYSIGKATVTANVGGNQMETSVSFRDYQGSLSSASASTCTPGPGACVGQCGGPVNSGMQRTLDSNCNVVSSQPCTPPPCCLPVGGGWSNNWYSVGSCNSCQQLQQQDCNNPAPSCGGTCPGAPAAGQRYIACGDANGTWSGWGTCSATCGGGTQTQSCSGRACNGADCSGPTSQSCNTQSCSRLVSDFNGDGKSDIFWRHSAAGNDWLWYMNGLSPAGVGLPTVDPSYKIVGVGDFNGDGHADILWRDTNGNGNPYFWLMNGSSIIDQGGISWSDPNWQVKGIGDFNGDGKDDILWQASNTGQIIIWFMNGKTISSQGTVVASMDLNWQIKGVGDFNNDHYADILWDYNPNGQAMIWYMNGATVTWQPYISTPAGANWQIKGAGDFNGDGTSDILWESTSYDVAIWLMQPNATIMSSGVISNIGSGWSIKEVEDFDGDHKSDILFESTSWQPYAWLMNGLTIQSQGNAGPILSDQYWEAKP